MALGFFGDAIESGVEGFGALAIGDVAIDEVEGGAAAVDDQGSGGEGNIQQGAIAVAALGFESELFAALQTLRDPVGFGGAIGRKDERVDGLRAGFARRSIRTCAEIHG